MDFLNTRTSFWWVTILLASFLAIDVLMLESAAGQTSLPGESRAPTAVPSIMAEPVTPTQKHQNGTLQKPNTKQTLLTNKGHGTVPVRSPAKPFSNALGPISEMPRHQPLTTGLTANSASISPGGSMHETGAAAGKITIISARPLGPMSEIPALISASHSAALSVNPVSTNVASQPVTQPRNATSVQANSAADPTRNSEAAAHSSLPAGSGGTLNSDAKNADTIREYSARRRSSRRSDPIVGCRFDATPVNSPRRLQPRDTCRPRPDAKFICQRDWFAVQVK